MIVLAWNCYGMGACGFGNLIKDICKEYETSLLFLFETHASKEEGVERILPKLGFDSSFIQPAHGHLGGIWCLWNDDYWKVHVCIMTISMCIWRWVGRGKRCGV